MNSSTPNKIAFCITDLDPGGAEKAMFEVVSRLDRSRWEPKVFCLGVPGELVWWFEGIDVPVTCLEARGGKDLGVVWRLRRELKQWKPALLQTFLFHANIAGRVAAKLAGIPVVVSGIRVSEKRSLWPLRLDRWSQSMVNAHVCVSRAVADFSIRESGLREDRVVVIRNGIDADRFTSAEPADLSGFGIPADARVVLFVGRLSPQKHPELLIDAMLELSKQSPDFENVHLLIAGDGPLRENIESRAQPISSRVHFAGRVEHAAPLMRAATVLLLPSRWEGLPNVVLEAMAAGLPVVATDVDGTPELIEDGVTGCLFPAEDVASCVAALKRVLSDTEFAECISDTAQTISQVNFTWDTVAAEYDALYSRLLPALG